MTAPIRALALLSILLPIAAAQPIRLDPKNPHYFLYRGKPVAPISSGEHYGAVINADFDYHRYLATLAADGLNYTRLFPGSYREVPAESFGIQRNTLAPAPGRFLAPWARSQTPGYAGGGNKFDLDRWDPDSSRASAISFPRRPNAASSSRSRCFRPTIRRCSGR